MSERIKKILQEAKIEGLTEESANVIATAFETELNKKADELAKLQVESALKAQDADYTAKCETLMEKIDADRANKLLIVKNKLEESYKAKLQKVIDRHEQVLHKEAVSHKNEFLEKIDSYLDVFLNDAIPHEQLKEAVANIRYKKIVEQFKDVLTVNEATVNESIKSAILDGKSQIESLQEQVDTLTKEKQALLRESQIAQSKGLIAEMTKTLPKEKAEFVTRTLSDKTPDYIKENFNYVVKLFDKDEQKTREKLAESAKQEKVLEHGKAEKQEQKIIKENVQKEKEKNKPKSDVDSYVDSFKGLFQS